MTTWLRDFANDYFGGVLYAVIVFGVLAAVGWAVVLIDWARDRIGGGE